MLLKDRVAIITGGAQGIGKGCAVCMAEEGAVAGILDMNMEVATATAKEIEAKGGKAVAKKVDVTNYAEVEKAIKEIHAQFGSIDILVNNAGIDVMKPFVDTDQALWDKLMNVDFNSFLICCHICAKYMMEQKFGKIISIASDSARLGQMNEVIYCGAKGAIISSSKGLARELARYNVNVNVISPGIVNTALIQELMETEQGKKIVEGTTKQIPFRRLGEPVDVGNLAVFFASEKSSFITGQVLSINGGLTMIG